MAKQTFTTGQVLTATQMNNLQANDYNWTTSAKVASYTLVAADAGTTITMTNASATTITVNTSLFAAGDTVRVINLGAGTCTITAGTATVNSAASLVLIQYASGTLWFSSASAAIFIPDDRNSGLTLIKAQTIGSTVSSVQVTSAFNSNYDNYKILISGGAASTNLVLRLAMGATATGYYQSLINGSYSTTTLTNNNVNNATSWTYAGYGGANGLVASFDVISPNLAKITFMGGLYADNAGSGYLSGYLNNTTQYTDFTITTSTGTVTGGTIFVFGYQNS